MATALKHQTRLQLTKRLRDRFRDASGKDACRIAHRILALIADGTITDANCANAWNMTADKWLVKKAELQVRSDKWTAYRAAETTVDGERGD